MLKMIFQHLILVLLISITQARPDPDKTYCRFDCKNGDKSDVTKGYYYRDFLGVIPPDALPIGGKNQFPQTYVGTAFDPENHGDFVTTIIEGFPYVNVAFNGKVNKLTMTNSVIQILCTMEIDKMKAANITDGNDYGDIIVAEGGVHFIKYDETRDDYTKQVNHFITIITKDGIKYAGSVNDVDEPTEYATIDGKPQSSTQYSYLFYDNNPPSSDQDKKQKSMISIPNFQASFDISSCSVSCKSGDMSSMGASAKIDFKNSNQALMTLDYYRKPKYIFKQIDKKDAYELEVLDYYSDKETVYLAQGYFPDLDWFDAGVKRGSFFEVSDGEVTSSYFHEYTIFSTKNTGKFKWVSSDSENFQKMDKSNLVCGGKMNNGTDIYYCKKTDPSYPAYPGSLVVTKDSVYCAAAYSKGKVTMFDVLQYVP